MARDGIYWFTGPEQFAQKLSVFSEQVESLGPEAVEATAKAAEKAVLRKVNTGQQRDGRLTGAPAVISGRMRDSVGHRLGTSSRGRATATWGFINNPPEWTTYKEDGTSKMIPLRAMAAGVAAAQTELDNQLDKAGVKIQTYWNRTF